MVLLRPGTNPKQPQAARTMQAKVVANLQQRHSRYQSHWDGKESQTIDMPCPSWDKYLELLAHSGAWGGALEIQAWAATTNQVVVIHSAEGTPPNIFNDTKPPTCSTPASEEEQHTTKHSWVTSG